MVGDSLAHDVAGARQAGMRGILLARGDRHVDAGADVPVIRSLAELPALVATLAGSAGRHRALAVRSPGHRQARECRARRRRAGSRSGARTAKSCRRRVLLVSAKRGGILLGAVQRRQCGLVGFVWSHARRGVTTASGRTGRTCWACCRTSRGIGSASGSSWAQRERALAQGVDLIEWTFDPLQAPNAHLNLQVLGSVGATFLRGHLRPHAGPAASRHADRSADRRMVDQASRTWCAGAIVPTRRPAPARFPPEAGTSVTRPRCSPFVTRVAGTSATTSEPIRRFARDDPDSREVQRHAGLGNGARARLARRHSQSVPGVLRPGVCRGRFFPQSRAWRGDGTC